MPVATAAVPAPGGKACLSRFSVEEFPKANNVREMMPLEHGLELSSLRGECGFAHYLNLRGAFALLDEFYFSVNREQNEESVEIHKTPPRLT